MNIMEMELQQVNLIPESELPRCIQLLAMERGVAKPNPPTLQSEIEVDFEYQTVYTIKRGYYDQMTVDSLLEANMILESVKGHLHLDQAYESGRIIKHITNENDTLSIEAMQAVTSASWEKNRETWRMNAKVKADNKAESETYEKASQEYNELVSAVKGRWQRAKIVAASVRRQFETWIEYLELADNNAHVAFGFLQKIYDYDTVQEIISWRPIVEDKETGAFNLLVLNLEDYMRKEDGGYIFKDDEAPVGFESE